MYLALQGNKDTTVHVCFGPGWVGGFVFRVPQHHCCRTKALHMSQCKLMPCKHVLHMPLKLKSTRARRTLSYKPNFADHVYNLRTIPMTCPYGLLISHLEPALFKTKALPQNISNSWRGVQARTGISENIILSFEINMVCW